MMSFEQRSRICIRSLAVRARAYSWATSALLTTMLAATFTVGTATTSGSLVNQARAQDVQVTGPLAGAPAVRNLRIWRKGRLQFEPNFTTSLRAEYARSLFVGANLSYGLTDWLSIGIWGAYGIASLDTELTKEIEAKGGTTNRNRLNLPNRERFSDQIGRLNWMGGADVIFTPLRGKLSMFQKVFVDTDLSLFAGIAAVGIEERANVSDSTICDSNEPNYDLAACNDSQLARASRLRLAPSFGIGLNMYFRRMWGISLRWRGMPFSWNPSGTDEAGDQPAVVNGEVVNTFQPFPNGKIDGQDYRKRFNNMLTVGVIILLPPKQKVTD